MLIGTPNIKSKPAADVILKLASKFIDSNARDDRITIPLNACSKMMELKEACDKNLNLMISAALLAIEKLNDFTLLAGILKQSKHSELLPAVLQFTDKLNHYHPIKLLKIFEYIVVHFEVDKLVLDKMSQKSRAYLFAAVVDYATQNNDRFLNYFLKLPGFVADVCNYYNLDSINYWLANRVFKQSITLAFRGKPTLLTHIFKDEYQHLLTNLVNTCAMTDDSESYWRNIILLAAKGDSRLLEVSLKQLGDLQIPIPGEQVDAGRLDLYVACFVALKSADPFLKEKLMKAINGKDRIPKIVSEVTPLHCAIFSGDTKAVENFIQAAKHDPEIAKTLNKPLGETLTPLLFAVLLKEEEIACLLIDAKVNLELPVVNKDEKGEKKKQDTILMQAVRLQLYRVVEALVEHHANRSFKNGRNNAIRIAIGLNDSTLSALILEEGKSMPTSMANRFNKTNFILKQKLCDETPIEYALRMKNNHTLLKTLIFHHHRVAEPIPETIKKHRKLMKARTELHADFSRFVQLVKAFRSLLFPNPLIAKIAYKAIAPDYMSSKKMSELVDTLCQYLDSFREKRKGNVVEIKRQLTQVKPKRKRTKPMTSRKRKAESELHPEVSMSLTEAPIAQMLTTIQEFNPMDLEYPTPTEPLPEPLFFLYDEDISVLLNDDSDTIETMDFTVAPGNGHIRKM